MYRNFILGLMAVALVVSPAYAGKKSARGKTAHPARKKVVHKTGLDFEKEAWGDSTPSRVSQRKPTKKTTIADQKITKEKAQPTVKLNPGLKKPEKVAQTLDVKGKTAEEIEKVAKAQKDPDQAIAAYTELVDTNPDYAYAGDVYRDMYRLSTQNGMDTPTRLKFAGKAAAALEQGRSRGRVDPREVQRLKRDTDKLINQWIEEMTQQIVKEYEKK